jgi:hypothetical protein
LSNAPDLIFFDEVCAMPSRATAQRIGARMRESAKMLGFLAAGGMNPMRGRRFVYSAAEWSRLEAWQHLTAQLIPGAPHPAANQSRVPWRKAHNTARGEWAWIYVG